MFDDIKPEDNILIQMRRQNNIIRELLDRPRPGLLSWWTALYAAINTLVELSGMKENKL